MIGLTPTQRKLFDFIAAEIATKGVAPSIREMSAACGLNHTGVYGTLERLEARGAIKRGRRAREIEITQSTVTLNSEILILTDRYAAEHRISRDTAVNELLRNALEAA